MELGAHAVLINTAIAIAANPVAMASAFRNAVEAGRTAFNVGLSAPSATANATSPLDAFLAAAH
jgi:thiazole synthase